MAICDVCFGFKIYRHETCIACNGSGEKAKHGDRASLIGHGRNIYHEMFLNKYQHLVDENIYLSHKQKEILRVLLTSDSFFIPFSFDGDWDYVYIEGKVKLVAKMLKGNWHSRLLGSNMEDEIYMLDIQFKNSLVLSDFGIEFYKRDTRQEAKGVEIFLPYHDYVKFYKHSIFECSAQFWRNVIKNGDLLEVHKEDSAIKSL